MVLKTAKEAEGGGNAGEGLFARLKAGVGIKRVDSALAKGDWEKAVQVAAHSRSREILARVSEAAVEAKRWDVLGHLAGRADRHWGGAEDFVCAYFARAEVGDVDAAAKKGEWDTVLNVGLYGGGEAAVRAVDAARDGNKGYIVHVVGARGKSAAAVAYALRHEGGA